MKEIDSIFPITVRGEYTKLGFSGGAKLRRDENNTMLISSLSGYRLPDESVELKPFSCLTQPNIRTVRYIPKDLPSSEYTLEVKVEHDDLIRSILTDPRVYAIEDVFSEMKKYGDRGQAVQCSCLLAYIDKDWVITCVPAVILY